MDDLDRRKRAGNFGEAAALGYIEAKGYTVLAEKFKAGSGEIDIIARDGDYLVFVEVKYRRQAKFGSPVAAITPAKMRTMISAARRYLAKNHLIDANCRFDVIEIFGRELLEINHIENAFWEN